MSAPMDERVLALYVDGEFRGEMRPTERGASIEDWTPDDGKQHHIVAVFGPSRRGSKP